MPAQPSTFGECLRFYRESAGLSQEALAERAGLSSSAIGALERGERKRPYPHTVQLLAEVLDLDERSRAALIAALPRHRSRSGARPSVTALNAPIGLPGADDGNRPTDHRRDLPADSIPRTTASHSTTFVGRQTEWAVLQERLAGASAGRGSMVALVGEAGIGKTRLAREFADHASSEGAIVLWGRCFEGDWQPPFGPWVEALGAYVRAHSPDSVAAELGDLAPVIAKLVPEVRTAFPGLPSPSALSADEERFRLYDATVRLLLTIAETETVLLVLDDLHWADRDSLRLLRYLARFLERERMLVVGTYRDPEFGLDERHPLMGTISALRREVDYERIAIQGLSHDEMSDFLASAAGQPVPRLLTRLIDDETNGNPFYAREVFRHLTEEGKVLHRGGRWTTDTSIRGLGIPDGVREVVGRRVARLSDQTSALLRLAVGFTAGFEFEVLQRLSGLEDDVLLSCLDEALQAGLIRTAAQSPPPRYEFAHAIVRHTLYGGLSLDRRTRLHRRIAIALEQTRRGVEQEDGELAAQYHASASLPGAVNGIPYALRAAEAAKAAYAHERAAHFLRMARDLAVDSAFGQKAEILRQLALAEAEAVDLGNGRQTANEAVEAMTAAGVEPRARAEFLATVARALKEGGAVESVWKPLVERGLALVGEARDLTWARLALLLDHFEIVRSGPVSGSQWRGSDPQAVAVARAEGDEEDYAHTLNPLDHRSLEETEPILALARTWSRPWAVMRALDVAGRDLLYRHGRFRESLALYRELLAVSERFGSIPNQGEALVEIGTSQLAIGDLLAAQEAVRRAREATARLGAGHRIKFSVVGLTVALAYFLDGDWTSFAAETRDFATSESATRSPVGIHAGAYAAVSAARAGEVGATRTLLEHLTPVFGRVEPTAYALSVGLATAGIAVWELEAVEYADTYRRLALAYIAAGVSTSPFGPLELWVARMSALLGDLSGANAYFERARQRLDPDGYTHVRAIVDHDQAVALLRWGVPDRARILSLLDAASGGFASHGMVAWAKRAADRKRAVAKGA